MQSLKFIPLLALLLMLAACAPENLDITPSPTATNTPEPTPTRSADATPTPDAEAAPAGATAERALLDHLLAAVPGTINAGAIQWRRANEDIQYRAEDGGETGRIRFTEAGGGEAFLTWGVFGAPEGAVAFYDRVLGQLRTLENSETRDNFPQPNAFGGGTYGSDAIFAQDNLYIRISVPRFSSTAGDPLVPLARQVFTILEGALVSFAA